MNYCLSWIGVGLHTTTPLRTVWALDLTAIRVQIILIEINRGQEATIAARKHLLRCVGDLVKSGQVDGVFLCRQIQGGI